MARPTRAAAKKVSYKPNTTLDNSAGSEGEIGDFQDAEHDGSDSDEYVTPDENVDAEDDEALDENDADGSEDEPYDDEDEEEMSKSTKKSKDRKQETGKNSTKSSVLHTFIQNVEIIPSSLPVKMTNRTINLDRKRSTPHPLARRNAHQKGMMHASDKNPDSWKSSENGPSVNDLGYVSMTEEALRDTVYPHIGSNIKDLKVITDLSDLEEYLPILVDTTIKTRDDELKIPVFTGEFVRKKDGLNDYYLINSGLSVWSLDWCPLPSNDKQPEENADYIAIAGFPETAQNCRQRDQSYPMGKLDSHLNIIQLWSANCTTGKGSETLERPSVHLALCILHNYGAVLDMKWCPTGNLMEAGPEAGSLKRLGILAAAFTDGAVRIFSVPEPKSLQNHLDINNDKTSETIYIEFVEPYVTLRLGETYPMSINWGTSERLMAGYSNGAVAIWDTKSILDQSSETLAQKDCEYLDPLHFTQLHNVCIRSVDFLRDEDASFIPNLLVSASYDGRVRYMDTRDMFSHSVAKTMGGVPTCVMGVPWSMGFVYMEMEGLAKMDQLFAESAAYRVFNAKSTVWDLGYSDFHPYLACAAADGRLLITNPALVTKRGMGMVQNTVYQLRILEEQKAAQEYVEEDVEGSSPAVDNVYQYDEDGDWEFTQRSDGYVKFYHISVAIQKVQWSKSYHSASWLASGSSSGLVRIDNMIRGASGGPTKRTAAEHNTKSGKAAKNKGGINGPIKKGRPRREDVQRDAKTGRIVYDKSAKKKGSTAKRGRGKGKSKATSTEKSKDDNDNDNDDDDDDDDSLDKDKDFESRDKSDDEGTSSTPAQAPVMSSRPVRSTRTSATTLASIFTMAKSKPSQSNGDNNGRDKTGSEEEEGPLIRVSKATPQPSSNTPAKHDFRVTAQPAKSAGNKRTIVVGVVVPQRQQDQDIVMEESTDATTDTAPFKSLPDASTTSMVANAARSTGGGRQPSAQSSKVASVQDKDVVMTEASVEEVTTCSPVQPEEAGPAPSSRASSPVRSASSAVRQQAPASSRKTRGPYKSKKKAEEVSRQTRSVMDLWGAAAKKNLDESRSSKSTKSAQK
ncbi:hypothetical protein BG004_000793 [Podila humilis]|nr:hypothetical protein BG004_000793 [Podila humilis]